MPGRHRHRLRLLGALATPVLLMLAGCGGGSATSADPARANPPQRLAPAAATRRHRRERIARLREVGEAELVAGDEGWARTGTGVYWTADGGRAWRTITPPIADPVELQSVYFRDREHGWALAEEGREVATRPVFFSTVDGGRSWRRAPVRIHGLLLPAAGASFDPLGGGRVLALVRESGDTASNVGFLLASDDGGRSWRQTGRPPQAGRIAFETRRDGWLASGFPAPRLWRTHDGGRHWAEVNPPGTPVGKPVGRFDTLFLPPSIGGDGHGLLPAILAATRNRDTTAVVYATGDFGRHWRAVDTTPLPRIGGTIEAATVFAQLGPATVLLDDSGAGQILTIGSGGEEARRTVRGLPDFARLSFSGPRYGFAHSPFGRSPPLVFSADAGASWRRVAEPR